MSTNRKSSNQHLRKIIDKYLMDHKKIEVYTFIKLLSPQRHYSLSVGRISALIRERDDVIRVKTGVWELK